MLIISLSNFENASRRIKQWIDENPPSGVVAPNITSNVANETITKINLSASQRRRIKQYLKRCRAHPRHSQLNLEGYLMLPISRIPRYRLLVRLSFTQSIGIIKHLH